MRMFKNRKNGKHIQGVLFLYLFNNFLRILSVFISIFEVGSDEENHNEQKVNLRPPYVVSVYTSTTSMVYMQIEN